MKCNSSSTRNFKYIFRFLLIVILIIDISNSVIRPPKKTKNPQQFYNSHFMLTFEWFTASRSTRDVNDIHKNGNFVIGRNTLCGSIEMFPMFDAFFGTYFQTRWQVYFDARINLASSTTLLLPQKRNNIFLELSHILRFTTFIHYYHESHIKLPAPRYFYDQGAIVQAWCTLWHFSILYV